MPEGSSALRRQFEPTDTVYVRFFLRLSKGWGWTGRPYHPHLMHFMTTEDGKYHGPAASHLTVYIEPQEGRLRLAAQDIQNRGTHHGLTQGPLRGGYNGTFFDSNDKLFTDDAWHCVEAMFRLNSLDLGRDRPRADGVVRAWFDGRLVIDRTDVVLRSADFPDMKFNQFLLAPYFGPGLLPHEQALWTSRSSSPRDRSTLARTSEGFDRKSIVRFAGWAAATRIDARRFRDGGRAESVAGRFVPTVNSSIHSVCSWGISPGPK